MAYTVDLPIELLPIVFQFIVRPNDLAVLCLVNSSFHAFAIPLLYERAFIYPWYNDSKTKLVELFRTLAENLRLARYVKQLVIKDFPKGLITTQSEKIRSLCARGIRSCVNLRHCTWTRDGSISSEILEALLDCPNLQELEINGHHDRHWDPRELSRFNRLRTLTLIMPSSLVIEQLPSWTRETGSSLRHLSLICKSDHLVTDALLEAIAPNLSGLQQLSLLGCPRVTDRGIWAVLSSNVDGISGIGLEGLSPSFDLVKFSQQCHTSGVLSRLRTFTTTVQHPIETWGQNVLRLLRSSPLEMFQAYSPGGEGVSHMPDDFCFSLVSAHGIRLRRFSVHRMWVSLDAVEDICTRCPNLDQLFIVMKRRDMRVLGPILAKAPKLRSVHVNYPLDSSAAMTAMTIRSDALKVVQECGSSSIVQFGCNTRVWQVERPVSIHVDGKISNEVQLVRYENPDVAEQFLVMRA